MAKDKIHYQFVLRPPKVHGKGQGLPVAMLTACFQTL